MVLHQLENHQRGGKSGRFRQGAGAGDRLSEIAGKISTQERQIMIAGISEVFIWA
jgi:hypothetical protein